jgi:hypothetical protein
MFAVGSNAPNYGITKSLRIRASATAYLQRTFGTPTSNLVWTWSGWIKRGQLSGSARFVIYGFVSIDATTQNYFAFDNDNLYYLLYDGTTTASLRTTQVFRDPAAWYHLVVSVDNTQATASNRVKLYVNGSQVTSFSSATYPASNQLNYINRATFVNGIGAYSPYLTNSYFDGYITEVNFIDGQALTPSSFGLFNAQTGVWQPISYRGTYGSNGFYLPFTDNSALTSSSNVGLGKDFSGNSNYWTTNNISITTGVTYDSMRDVPTLTSDAASNYCTLNPLKSYDSTGLSNGSLRQTISNGTYWSATLGTIGVSSGKWYWETTFTNLVIDSKYGVVGIAPGGFVTGLDQFTGLTSTSYGYFNQTGYKYVSGVGSAYGASFTNGDVIGIALDLTAGTLTFYKNNVSQGVAFSGISGLYFPGSSTYNGSTQDFNFGQQPFTYTPPTGFLALTTYNLPNSTIVKGNRVMDATLYTGTGATLSVTNAASFKPDLVWIKSRSGAYNNALFDSVRGVNKVLISNTTDSEQTETAGSLSAFNSNGFTLASGTAAYAAVNVSGQTFVGWQWQAGQGSTSSNTNGTITSTVSVNASAGFSVVTFTGTGSAATVGHGLGVAPQFIITKWRTSSVRVWYVYHTSIGPTGGVYLNATNATVTNANIWNNTAPTSSVFSVGALYGGDTVAYCWTPIAGYSEFGSYTGNGSTDGTFVYTGFSPKFVMIKEITTGGTNWNILDTARDPYNVEQKYLAANLSDAEGTLALLDGLSNGFKLRSSGLAVNASGSTYIYMAFASNPFKNSLAF